MSILSLNCQSIYAKLDRIKIYLHNSDDMNSLSIICIQETWSQDDIDMTALICLIILCRVQKSTYLRMAVLLHVYNIHDNFAFKVLNATLPITHTSMLFESLIIEVWKKK